MNKKEEIEKMACDICLWRHGCNSPNNPIESCKPLHMAKKAVEAGYGDVRAAVREFASKVKELIHGFENISQSTDDCLCEKIDELIEKEYGDGV